MDSPFSRLLSSLRALSADRRGNVAITFSVTILPAMLLGGMAIDYSRLVDGNSRTRSALDAAVLRQAQDDALNATVGARTLAANSGFTIVSSNFTTKTNASGDTVYVGDATVKVPLTFGKLAGVSTMNVAVHSEATPAAKAVTTAKFKPTNVQGAFSKDIFIFTKNAAGVITSQTNVITYRYSPSTGRVSTPAVGSATTSFTVPPYSTFGVGMVIYEDLTYTGKLVSPRTVYSDAADAYTWIKTSGACTDGSGQSVMMEDGGDSNFLDLDYTMYCTMARPAGSVARLTN